MFFVYFYFLYLISTDTLSWCPIKLQTSISARAGHSILSLTGSAAQMTTSSAEEQEEEKENTPNRAGVKKNHPHKLMLFAGGDNDGAFFNDLIKVNIKLEDL